MSAYVYILSSPSGTLYVGSTVELDWRVNQHKTKHYPKSFTARYDCTKLVYFEELADLETARLREIQIKKWNRSKKEALIRLSNPAWIDLFEKRKRRGEEHP